MVTKKLTIRTFCPIILTYTFSRSSGSSRLGMKSFSTMSITGEIEKEDKIRELEIVVDDQRAVIQNQNLRIQELEVAVSEIGNGFHQNGFSQNQSEQNTDREQEENEEQETNGHYHEDEN